MKPYFAYIRVSTVKQGEHGSSLQEQRDAIDAFARRNDIKIIEWFEERETAAKIGRREFSRMLRELKRRKASGVIFHKIDRSTRNLKDWSVIQELAEEGIDVRFSQESVNLGSNEGRLTGDFLAVIASHYIRNLQEEVKKGMRGRLKQGLYPLQAPIGYLDQGGGKPKIPDPLRAPLIKQAFELYATGRWSLRSLATELYSQGFRTKSGRKVTVNSLAKLLRNPFYIGIIRMKGSGENYAGVHEPIIAKQTFDRVQQILDGKAISKAFKHDFIFRRMIACGHCQYHLIGELQKGHVYYRCQTKDCPTCTIREEAVDETIQTGLSPLSLSEGELDDILRMADNLQKDWAGQREELLSRLRLRRDKIEARLRALMDAYLDGTFDRQMFEEKKLSLLMERQDIDERALVLPAEGSDLRRKINNYLEPLKSLQFSYESGDAAKKRDLLKTLTSNLVVDRKNISVELRSPFREAANFATVSTGAPPRDRPRTFTQNIFEVFAQHCKVPVSASLSKHATF